MDNSGSTKSKEDDSQYKQVAFENRGFRSEANKCLGAAGGHAKRDR